MTGLIMDKYHRCIQAQKAVFSVQRIRSEISGNEDAYGLVICYARVDECGINFLKASCSLSWPGNTSRAGRSFVSFLLLPGPNSAGWCLFKCVNMLGVHTLLYTCAAMLAHRDSFVKVIDLPVIDRQR